MEVLTTVNPEVQYSNTNEKLLPLPLKLSVDQCIVIYDIIRLTFKREVPLTLLNQNKRFVS